MAASGSANKIKEFDWILRVECIEYDFNNNIDKDLYSLFDKPDQLIHLAWDGVFNYNDLAHT
jgi:dTDP-6-deoxy-L-talose 4-dehydrogenase (NAD+)